MDLGKGKGGVALVRYRSRGESAAGGENVEASGISVRRRRRALGKVDLIGPGFFFLSDLVGIFTKTRGFTLKKGDGKDGSTWPDPHGLGHTTHSYFVLISIWR